MSHHNLYVPVNGPAIGDLFDMFELDSHDKGESESDTR